MPKKLALTTILLANLAWHSPLPSLGQESQPNIVGSAPRNDSSQPLESRFPSSWSLAINEAKSYTPATESSVENVRQQLQSTLRSLESFFNANPSWRTFLEVDALRQSLENWKSTDESLIATPSMLKAWWVATDSLDLTQVAQTSKKIREINALIKQRLGSENSSTRLERLVALDNLWKDFQNKNDEEARTSLISKLLEMESLGQASVLVRDLKGICLLPNLLIQMPASTAMKFETKPISDSFSTSGLYNRVQMAGSGTISGTQTVQLVPNSKAAEWEVSLRGTSRATSRGAISEVSVQSSSTSEIYAAKRIALTGWGRWSFGQSVSSAPTSIRYDSISPNSRGRARERTISEVQASKRSSEAQAQRETEDSLRTRLDQEVANLVRRIDLKPLLQLRDTLVKTKSDILTIDYSSSSTGALVAIRCYDPASAVYPVSAPPQVTDGETIASIHQSLLDRILESKLTSSEFGFNVQIAEANATQSDSGPIGTVGERVRLVFDAKSPIQADCDETGLRTILRLQSVTDGDTTIRDCRLEFDWDLASTKDGLRMTRREKIRVLPINFNRASDRLNARQISAYRAVERALSTSIGTEQMLDLSSILGKVTSPEKTEVQVGRGWLQLVNRP